MGTMRNRALVCLWAQLALLVEGCHTPKHEPARPAKPVAVAPPATPPVIAAPSGRAEQAFDAKETSPRLVLGTPDPRIAAASAQITDIDAAPLVARMEPLPDVTGAPAPVMRPTAPPPPKSGTVQPIAFVAPSGKPVGDAPLPPVIERHLLTAPQIQPTGEVQRESEIRVRFDEPMVPVAQVGEVAHPPATIAPAAQGTWRWIDTRVLTFTSKGLPGSTEFTITVPAGVKAVSGAELVAPVTSTFTTGRNRIESKFPYAVRPDVPFAIQLAQDADPAAIAKLLTVRDAKKRPVPFVVVSLDEAKQRWATMPMLDLVKIDEKLSHPIAIAAKSGAWPAGATLDVELAKGAPSKEGPLLGTRESDTRFIVAKPFTLLGVECDGKDPKLSGMGCPANGWAELHLSNPVLEKTWRADKVQLEGEPFQDHEGRYQQVGLSLPNKPGKTMTAVVGDGLIDEFGQAFVGPHRATFLLGPERWMASVEAREGMFVLDPRFEVPQWQVEANAVASLRIELFQVQPNDFFAYQQLEDKKAKAPPGKRVFDKVYAIGKDRGVRDRVDLRPALVDGVGQVIAVATVTGSLPPEQEQRHVAWIQVSKLGLSTRIDGEQVSAWATHTDPKHFLEPLNGAQLQLVRADGTKTNATTDADGHAALELLAPVEKQPDLGKLLVLSQGRDSVFAQINADKSVRREQARWYITDDRFLYKPGEKAYVKGWVRWTSTGVNPGLALPKAGEVVHWTLTDRQKTTMLSGDAPLSDQGGFDIQLDLPATAKLGWSELTLETRTERNWHGIDIEEFRTPAYSVNLDDDLAFNGARPLILGERIDMRAEAKYYAGGGLGGASISWEATLSPGSYRPPGWDGYTYAPPRGRADRWNERDARSADERLYGTLGGSSSASLSIGIAALSPNQPGVLNVDATVEDLDRMHIRASSRKIVVHPSAYYVGLRAHPEMEGKQLDAVVTDIDGAPVTGVDIDVAIEGVLPSERWRDDAKIVDAQHCALVSAAEPVACAWHRDAKLVYVAVARIADAKGRPNATQMNVPWWEIENQRGTLSVVPDKAIYKPGDIAKIQIVSTIVPATAVMTFARQGVVAQKKVALTQSTTTVELPIDDAFIQNIYVEVDRWSADPKAKGAGPFPEHEAMTIELPVDRESARLAMTARALKPVMGPGEEATYEVTVRRADKPVANAEVALIVVDEAVLSLSGRKYGDPLEPFYRHVEAGTHTAQTYAHIVDDGDLIALQPGIERYKLDEVGYGRSGYGVGGGGGAMRGRVASAPSVSIGGVVVSRKDFRPNAVFSPKLHTDARGVARLTVKLPDNLTRWRVVAIASDGAYHFGLAEGTLIAQAKLNARMVVPRFLSQGDAFALPVVVQNLSEQPKTIDVAVRAANLASRGAMAKRVTVPGGQRAELRFGFATEKRGRAALQVVAISGNDADGSTQEVQVYAPATTESFATYGTVDNGAAFEQLAVPKELYPEVGGMEVELASTQLQSLTDAYWYLYAYPYECAEQRSSRMLATQAMASLLDAFQAPGRPTPQQIEQQRKVDVAKLMETQLPGGGWGYFSGMKAEPFVSIQVVSALGKSADAKAIGFVQKLVAAKLATLEKAAQQKPIDRANRDELPADAALAAVGLAALNVTGAKVAAQVDRLDRAARALDAYPMDAKARVLALKPSSAPARAKLLAELLAATHETAAGASVTTQYTPGEHLLLVSSPKTTALALDAIMREAPQQPIATKLARGLLAAREHGRWHTTQENAVVLMAMKHYFDTYEKDVPAFTGRVWVGAAGYAEQAFQGRSSVRAQLQLGWTALGVGSSHDLAIQKDGTGRLYYRIGITYAPKQVDLPALDAGFVVRRSYVAVDDPKDVEHRADGSWHIKLGAKVLVQVQATNTTLRNEVALVDPLPAGFEIVNTRLAVAERGATGAKNDWAWSHVEMRDNAAQAFAFGLGEGAHDFQYTVRATTPGTFIAAPAKAEEMYAPETFGRSNGTVVVVE